MIRLGIIGAESSHSYSIARTCNVDKTVSMRVSHLWGETEAFAASSARKGAIPHVVHDWHELLGKVDGVMIAHRDGSRHYEPARFFIDRKVPTFIDKPLTTDLDQAKELLSLAARKKTPVCSFSVIPFQSRFRAFVSRLSGLGPVKAVNSNGPLDIGGRYGVFFHGIHQVDAIVEIMGTAAKSAQLHRVGKNSVATIFFSGGRFATLNGIAKDGVFHWSVCLDDRMLNLPHVSDANLYLAGTKLIYRLIRFGEVPWSRSRMLVPIAILEALQRSLRSGQKENVPAA